MVHPLLSRRSLKMMLLRSLHGFRMRCQYLFDRRRPDSIVFILCPWPRTGSNLLRTYLSSHPSAELRGEVLSRDEVQGIRWRYVTQQVALRHLRVSVMTSGRQVGGCKLMMYQLRHFGIGLNDLRDLFSDAKFLILYRESLVEQYVSWQLGMKTGVWIQDANAKPSRKVGASSVQIRFDIDQFNWFADDVRKNCRAIAADMWVTDNSVLVAYEDLCRNPNEVIHSRICPFLGLTPAPVSTDLVKQNPRDIQQIVENYADVESFLQSAKRDNADRLTPTYMQGLFRVTA